MKKNTILILFFLFSFIYVSAQEKIKHSCGSDVIHLKLLKEDDSYKEKFEKNNLAWSKFIKKRESNNNKNAQTLLNHQETLTVVFHDVKNDPNESFLIGSTGSYQYIVDKLNLIYDGTNLGGKAQTNDTQIQFCLALQDKNVNPYIGNITHHSTSLGSIDKDNINHIDQIVTNSGATSKFPTKNYINVYIVDEIIGSVTGFAFLPSAHGKSYDGIFIEREYLVNNPSLDINMNVLAHEMGHYLGLFHVFGICDPATILTFPQCSCDNSNPIFNGDMVADTQPMELNFTCSPAPTSCGSTIPDDKSNYMDYGDFTCQNKFTPGQIDRMHFMIDSEFGARNSLLETKSCDICTGLFNCNFTIQIPNAIIANEVVVNTPLIFNVNTNCSNNPSITYNWELFNLDTNTLVLTVSLQTFNQTITVVGNYKLTLKASLTSNPNCVEVANPFYFKVIPEQGNSGPGSGTDYCKTLPDLNFSNFERVQYEKGWSLGTGSSLTNYTWPSTERYVETDAGFEPNSFEIIDQSTFSDVNFPSAANVPFGVNKILRVGRVINQTNVLPDGAAYYVKVKFKPTPDNCKFLVHYLGMKQVTTTPETASLGLLVQLSYESPLHPGYIKHIGQSEWGNKWEGTSNLGATTSLYNEFNKISSNGDFTSPNIVYGLKDYKTTVQWKTKLLDFSEFAILNQGTNQNFEVTLTFFVRSNDQSAGTQQAYAYYGIQCLGGGLPDNVDFNVSNFDLPCQFPENSQECVDQTLTYPSYFPSGSQAYNTFNSNNYALGNYTREYSDDDVTYFPYTSVYLPRFCKGNNSYPYRYFKITYTTLTQTIVKKFRITNQFFHNEPPCSPAVDIGGVNNSASNLNTYFCSGNANFTTGISFTSPCFSSLTQPGGVYTFRWLINGTEEVALGTDAVVNYTALNTYLNSVLKQNICNFDLKREVQYIDPYCGSKCLVLK
ncbi:M43 family zinc metalloprotease [Flavobacterium gelidilacus]|uniref:M43 family zinc metalloprotease n=1 Tax=Flavobacterium gelidilacus TaxID=206041 RepID=UPI0004793AF7|nr:M43 family zinc metalloprotease [Flavobacterium gelidilacus]